MSIKDKKNEKLNDDLCSIEIKCSDIIEQLETLKKSGQFAFGPDFQERNGKIYAVGITYGWSQEEKAIDIAYECIGNLIPPDLNPHDVVEVVYDEDSDDDCESIEFFGGIAQATPLVFNSLSGYDFHIIFD